MAPWNNPETPVRYLVGLNTEKPMVSGFWITRVTKCLECLHLSHEKVDPPTCGRENEEDRQRLTSESKVYSSETSTLVNSKNKSLIAVLGNIYMYTPFLISKLLTNIY